MIKTVTPITAITGPGLITGKISSVEIRPLREGSGILFQIDEVSIPAKPAYVINSDRGVTLGKDGKRISIVEHFLAACAITNITNLNVKVSGAPELPIYDGSAKWWVEFLSKNFKPLHPALSLKGVEGFSPVIKVKDPVYYTDPQNSEIKLAAIPDESLKITYIVDFPHPDLTKKSFDWNENDGSLAETIAPARTFGFLSELPKLQEEGLAKGATLENTLGLTDDGGYTTALRMPDEPVRHKVLDLIGDLMLCQIPITSLKAHLIVNLGGHSSHLAFGKLLYRQLFG